MSSLATHRVPGLVPSPAVRAAGDEEHLVLLDLASNQYFMLDATGAATWRGLAAGWDGHEIARLLHGKGAGPQDRLLPEITDLIEKLAKAGLLVPSTETSGQPSAGPAPALPPEETPSPVAPGRRHVFAAWVVLAWLDFLAQHRGFDRLLAALPELPAQGSGRDPGIITRTVGAVERAARYHVRRAWCLPRSAAATWLLRRQGFAAHLVLGVRPMPFYAHAWTEVEGRVVNDPSWVCKLHVLDRF